MTTFSTPAVAAKKPGPGLGLSIGILVIGLVVGVVSVVFFVRPFVKTFTEDAHFVTGGSTFTVDVSTGDYALYQRVDAFGVPTLTSAEVRLVGPSGAPLTGFAPSTVETIDIDSTEYKAAVRFNISDAGLYRVEFAPRTPPTEVIFTKTLGHTFSDAAPWLPSMILGGVAFIGGIAMLIVGIVRRSNASKQPLPAYGTPQATAPPAPQGTPPPGWYADPADGTRWRWWDGTTWTDRTS